MWCDLGESVRGRKCDIFIQSSIWLKSSLGEVHFAQNPTRIGPKLQQLKDSQNNRKQKKCIPFSGCFFFLAVSHNQCCRLSTDPARSQHIFQYCKLGKKNLKWNVH